MINVCKTKWWTYSQVWWLNRRIFGLETRNGCKTRGDLRLLSVHPSVEGTYSQKYQTMYIVIEEEMEKGNSQKTRDDLRLLYVHPRVQHYGSVALFFIWRFKSTFLKFLFGGKERWDPNFIILIFRIQSYHQTSCSQQ